MEAVAAPLYCNYVCRVLSKHNTSSTERCSAGGQCNAVTVASVYQGGGKYGPYFRRHPLSPTSLDTEPPACNSRQSPKVTGVRESLHDNPETQKGNAGRGGEKVGGDGEGAWRRGGGGESASDDCRVLFISP